MPAIASKIIRKKTNKRILFDGKFFTNEYKLFLKLRKVLYELASLKVAPPT
jgi:hypothetical protein